MTEPTVIIPASLALLMARYFDTQADAMLAGGHQRMIGMVESWRDSLILEVSEQCSCDDIANCVEVLRKDAML